MQESITWLDTFTIASPRNLPGNGREWHLLLPIAMSGTREGAIRLIYLSSHLGIFKL